MTDFEGIAGRLLVWSDEDPNGSIGQASKQMEKWRIHRFMSIYIYIYIYIYVYIFFAVVGRQSQEVSPILCIQ